MRLLFAVLVLALLAGVPACAGKPPPSQAENDFERRVQLALSKQTKRLKAWEKMRSRVEAWRLREKRRKAIRREIVKRRFSTTNNTFQSLNLPQ